MSNENFVINYVHACSSHQLPLADCGPVWQLGIIAAMLVMAIATLLILNFRSAPQQA
jgi:hypothetical protein